MKTLSLLALLILFLVPFASADFGDDLTAFFSESANWMGSQIGFIFSGKEIATQTLFAILLFMVLYTSVDALFRKKWPFTVIVTGIITALAIIALPPNFLTSIRNQYGALGATILAIIPFLIILIFTIRVESNLVGRVLWIFYALYYFALYIYSIATEKNGWLSAENIPYFAAIIGGIVLFLFISPIRNAIF